MYKIILILAAISATAFSGEPNKVLHEKCIYPSVMVLNENIKGNGSGVIVKSHKVDDGYENYVITCAHVLSGDGKEQNFKMVVRIGIYENWSTLVGSKEYHCEVAAINKIKDIAILKFKTENSVSVAEIYNNPKIYIGDDVIRVGCGLSEPFRVDYGKITAVDKSIGSMVKNSYRVSIPTIMGDSGGPVYHEDKVIGLMQSIHTVPLGPFRTQVSHMSYVIPIQRILELEEFSKIIGND
jgi:S1-C subfamily serine protease